jgi:ribosomal protein S19
MKQTAVEWLISVLAHNDILDHNKVSSNKQLYNLYRRLKNQAKAMEKEQIIKAHGNKKRMTPTVGNYLETYTGEQYYKETYK